MHCVKIVKLIFVMDFEAVQRERERERGVGGESEERERTGEKLTATLLGYIRSLGIRQMAHCFMYPPLGDIHIACVY